MGDGEGNENEKPERQVIITCIYMGKYPVTQAEYDAVMGINPSFNSGADKGDFPVERVSWYDAVEFCNKLSERDNLEPAYSIDKINQDTNNGNASDTEKWTVSMRDGAEGYRLPTEAEWEYACRAGMETQYSTGDTISAEQANFNSAGTRGGFAENPWGLYNMHGNVWEWCWDWYDENEYGNTSGRVGNPLGPAVGENRVRRGGSWRSADSNELRSAFRESAGPDSAADDIGFRVIRPKFPEGI
jgi:formylglycine-generating enzyme required for sulfatase activity